MKNDMRKFHNWLNDLVFVSSGYPHLCKKETFVWFGPSSSAVNISGGTTAGLTQYIRVKIYFITPAMLLVGGHSLSHVITSMRIVTNRRY